MPGGSSIVVPGGGGGEGRPRVLESTYSPFTGLIYIFNLIVGTGALTLPSAFHDAGWGLSTVILVILAFMSYLTATFMIESMAAANAMLHWKRLKRLKTSGGTGYVSDELITRCMETTTSTVVDSESETSQLAPLLTREVEDRISIRSANRAEASEMEPLLEAAVAPNIVEGVAQNISSYYSISEIIEMGKMTSLFFNRTGKTLFYLCITIYLCGDLAIYGAAVAKSLRDVACTYVPKNTTSKFNISDDVQCWEGDDEMSRIDVYRIALVIFVAVVGPFAFCNVQKTKYLQIFTTLMRWLAFVAMVTFACLRLTKSSAHPPVADMAGLPNLIGVSVYSFMCHHSLPSLVTPISRKKSLPWLLAFDYGLILSFYFLLSFTGIFAFREIKDLYTLNFQPIPGEAWYLAGIHYFLSLFPVFTLSTNFPIIAITLRNNLKALFLTEGRMYSWCTRSCVFPLMALVPPVAVALTTDSLEFLVGITGSYAGAGIQYVFPAFLVYFSRKVTKSVIGIGVKNHHSSFFKSTFWVIFVQLWALTCVIFVTWNHIASAINQQDL